MIAPIPPPVEDDALPAVLRLFPERSAPVRRALAVTLHARETIFDIPLPSVLGRKGSVAAAAFADDTTVSREHVELRASASAVVVRNIAVSGNTVHVDDRSIPLDASLRLGPGRYTLRFGSRFVCALVVSVA